MPVFSILMSAYNYAEYVAEAIDSVLAQTYRDWELIVIDDFSRDQTWDVVNTYHDPRVRVLRGEPNRSYGATLNAALELATGDLIAVLNADDRYRPAFLERHSECFRDNPSTGLVGCFITEIDAEGSPVEASAAEEQFNTPIDLKDPANWIWRNPLPGCAVLRRSAIEKIGTFNVDVTPIIDWDMWLRALAARVDMAVVPEPLFEWRVHGDNITNSDTANTVLCYARTSARTLHPLLDTVSRPDLRSRNVAGFLTHPDLARKDDSFRLEVLSFVVGQAAAEGIAGAVGLVADETNRLRTALVECNRAYESVCEARDYYARRSKDPHDQISGAT